MTTSRSAVPVIGFAIAILAGSFAVVPLLFGGDGLPSEVRGALPLWLVAAVFTASEVVRLRYHTSDGGDLHLSLGTFAWGALVQATTPDTAVLGSFLGAAIAFAIFSRHLERYLVNVALATSSVPVIWGLHRALAPATGPDPVAWGVIVVAIWLASLAQVGIIIIAMRLAGVDDARIERGEFVATSRLVLIMALLGVAAAELLAVSPWALILVGTLVLVLVMVTNLVDDQNRLVVDLQAERDDKDHRARHDALTGLPNRAEVVARIDRLADAPRQTVRHDADGTDAAVLLLDLNRFREVNETLGHDVGDQLLVEVANRLRQVAREGDTVARLGGDEYAVLVRDVDGARGALGAARRILRSLEQPYEQDGLLLETGASIGIALSPQHGRDATALLRRAEIAMYAAKDAGMGIVVHDVDDETRTPRRLRLVGELRRAIDHDEIAVAYQPKLDLRTGRAIGVEALARWTHLEDGPISPGEFIPIAERTGLIHLLTRAVVERAFTDVASWRSEGVDLGVAINISPRVLVDESFSEFLAKQILRHGLTADRVTLEVTESVVISESARIAETLRELEDLGVRLSIDDYGTGYSSLSYLRRLKVDELKVDRSFVMHMVEDRNDEVLVESTIKLGHALGLVVVAEGVEDDRALDRLRELGCDVAQGFHIGRPVLAPEVLPLALRLGVAAN